MLQKMGHFSSGVAHKMAIVINVNFSWTPRKFWGNRWKSICLQKWHISITTRGSKLAKFREKSGHQEAAGDVSENGPF